MNSIESRPIQILLVEPDEKEAVHALEVLRDARITNAIHMAQTAGEALDYLFNSETQNNDPLDSPLLVLISSRLPEDHGLELLRRIRSDNRTQAVPVVILAQSSEEQRKLEQTEKAARFMIQPFRAKEFVQAVSTLGFAWCLTDRRLGSPS